MKYLIAIFSIILGSFAQYLFKIGVDEIKLSTGNILLSLIRNIQIIGGLTCYGVSALLWFYVLSRMELSRAYPLVSLGYIFTAIIGYYCLGEKVDYTTVIGIAFIVAGVVVIALGN